MTTKNERLIRCFQANNTPNKSLNLLGVLCIISKHYQGVGSGFTSSVSKGVSSSFPTSVLPLGSSS